jgi:hypothetical protein
LGKEVKVVREDLVSLFPGPNNAKVRGIESKIAKLHAEGVKCVASQDTRISRIGWGVSWICKKYDIQHYNFYPECKVVPFYQRMSQYWGGQLIPIRGTYASAFRALCQRWMQKNGVVPYFLPIGASLSETLVELGELTQQLPSDLFEGSLVVNISSGTICAGLTYGCIKNGHKTSIYGIQGSGFKNRKEKIRNKIQEVTHEKVELEENLRLIDPGYEYREIEPLSPPFPCDLYLDRKAWKWLVDNIEILEEPIVFWNIGGEWDPIVGIKDELRGDGLVDRNNIKQYLL